MACCHCAARGGERTQLHTVMRPRRARVRHARHVHSGHVHSGHGVCGSARMLCARHERVAAAQHQAARPGHIPGRDQRTGEQCAEQQCCKPAAGEPALGVTVLHVGSLTQIRVVGHARLESYSRLRRTNQIHCPMACSAAARVGARSSRGSLRSERGSPERKASGIATDQWKRNPHPPQGQRQRSARPGHARGQNRKESWRPRQRDERYENEVGSAQSHRAAPRPLSRSLRSRAAARRCAIAHACDKN